MRFFTAKEKEEEEPKTALGKFLKKHNLDVEKDEVQLDVIKETDYPMPLKKYRMILEQHEESLEGMYYWMITNYEQDWGYHDILKVVDSFAASEQSSFFGVAQQRLGLQQDKVMQFLQATGKMVKELFQFVRELRIIDERLELYGDTYLEDSKKTESADISLKGIWIDLVEGGSKNPSSVYGLAREVGFTILPDLFFSISPKPKKYLKKDVKKLTRTEAKELVDGQIDSVDKVVDDLKGDMNRKVREVLKRKLRTHLQWKKETFAELITRRRFTLQYFRQHYDIIRMYMQWIKPYLRNIKRLGLDPDKMNSARLVSAFEGSIVEVEFLAKRKTEAYKDTNAVGVVNFQYRTRPAMSFQQEGYQRGPKHAGKAKITIRAYAWSDDMIEDYIKMRQKEDLDLIASIDSSLKAAMDALGDEMKEYLVEAGEKLFEEDIQKEKEDEPKKPSVIEPFGALFDGFGEIFGAFTGGFNFSSNKENKFSPHGGAKKDAENAAWRAFKNYRKAHKMITY